MVDSVTDAISTRIKNNPGIDVNALSSEISQNLGVKAFDVARCIHQLSLEKHVELVNPDPPQTLFAYAKSTYSLWFWAVISVTIITFISIFVLPQSAPYMYLRYGFGSLFVLYFPGYAFVEVLYPEKNGLSSLERLVLSIGLSLALTPLLGLVLNYTPWGIRLNPVLTGPSLLTLSLATAALARKFSGFKLTVKPMPNKMT